MKYVLLALIMLNLCACATKETPVIEKHVFVKSGPGLDYKFIGVIATTAQRRVIVFNDKGLFCAEPSPDATDNLISNVTASLEASLKSETGQSGSIAANAARSMISEAQFLIQRTQGLQLFRDGSFTLCTMRANGNLTDEEYIKKQKELLEECSSLIKKELALMAVNKEKYLSQKISKSDFSDRIEELKKLQEITKPQEKPENNPTQPAQ
ncbi:hypothetical protein [Maridesulfovibrio bastinii]|uniref:hypothetical protein n=1 Tax=Maridesulfovibrio bastinii TaxID=47157 RepID=UPI000402A467|nr:hypothetical protein [Maridesulfovibrio bastinii]